MRIRRFSAAIATGLLLCLLGAGAAEARSPIEVSTPTAVRAPQAASYSVRVPAGASRVSLFVDGERRWTARPDGRALNRSGRISTSDLGAGHHLIRVTAAIGRRVSVTTRTVRVKPQHKTSPNGGGSTSTESGKTSTGSTSSGAGSSTSSSGTSGSTSTSSGSGSRTAAEEISEPETSTAPTTEAPSTETSTSAAHNVFASGFDGSFSGWHLQSLAGRATINTTAPFAGSGAARFEVRPGDVEPETGSNRSEVSGPTFNSGEEFFVRDEIRVPSGYSYQGPWQLIQQLHDTDWSGSPATATFLSASRQISYASGNSRTIYWRGPQLELERWYTFVYHIKLAPNTSEGFVEIWLNGVQQVLQNGSTRMYGATIQTSQAYLKAGIYRDPTSTGISLIEHDDIVVGPSLASVMSY